MDSIAILKTVSPCEEELDGVIFDLYNLNTMIFTNFKSEVSLLRNVCSQLSFSKEKGIHFYSTPYNIIVYC